MTMQEFIKQNRAELDTCIFNALYHNRERALNNPPLNDKERREWILNDEGLYHWARSEGVRI